LRNITWWINVNLNSIEIKDFPLCFPVIRAVLSFATIDYWGYDPAATSLR
jgi:hypothetical protein